MSSSGLPLPIADDRADPAAMIVKHLHECQTILRDHPDAQVQLQREASTNPSLRIEFQRIRQFIIVVARANELRGDSQPTTDPSYVVAAAELEKEPNVTTPDTFPRRRRIGALLSLTLAAATLAFAALSSYGHRFTDASAAVAFLTGFASIAVGTSVISNSSSTLETIRQYIANE